MNMSAYDLLTGNKVFFLLNLLPIFSVIVVLLVGVIVQRFVNVVVMC